MTSNMMNCFFLLLFFVLINPCAHAAPKTPAAPAVPPAKPDHGCYLVSLNDKEMVLEKNGSNFVYRISPETKFACGFDSIPRKYLTPGIKFLLPTDNPYSLIDNAEVIPVFKKKKSASSPAQGKTTNSHLDDGVFFKSLDENVMRIVVNGEEQLMRVDSVTSYKSSNETVDKSLLKPFSKLILSSTVPWAYISSVEITGEIKSNPEPEPAAAAPAPTPAPAPAPAPAKKTPKTTPTK